MTDVVTPLTTVLTERCRVEREPGVRGMAAVCLTEDVRRHRHVAIKVLPP